MEKLKTYYARHDWRWDHPFPGEIGENGRWEISLYSPDDLTESGWVGYAALAPLPSGEWMLLILPDGGAEDQSFCFGSEAEAKRQLDLRLAADTPALPLDRDAADPWFGDHELLYQILAGMVLLPDGVKAVREVAEEVLSKRPPGKPPFPDP
jgi:hypothetical protein